MPFDAILFALLLIIIPSDGEQWVKIAVALSGGCSLGLLIGAWAAVQYAKKVWLSLAAEWSRTEDFEKAVKKHAAEPIRLAIEKHDQEKVPHQPFRHGWIQTELAKVSRGHWEVERDEKP